MRSSSGTEARVEPSLARESEGERGKRRAANRARAEQRAARRGERRREAATLAPPSSPLVASSQSKHHVGSLPQGHQPRAHRPCPPDGRPRRARPQPGCSCVGLLSRPRPRCCGPARRRSRPLGCDPLGRALWPHGRVEGQRCVERPPSAGDGKERRARSSGAAGALAVWTACWAGSAGLSRAERASSVRRQRHRRRPDLAPPGLIGTLASPRPTRPFRLRTSSLDRSIYRTRTLMLTPSPRHSLARVVVPVAHPVDLGRQPRRRVADAVLLQVHQGNLAGLGPRLFVLHGRLARPHLGRRRQVDRDRLSHQHERLVRRPRARKGRGRPLGHPRGQERHHQGASLVLDVVSSRRPES